MQANSQYSYTTCYVAFEQSYLRLEHRIMNLTEKDYPDKQHETLYRNIGMVVFCVLGVLLIYGYYVVDSSENVNHYFSIAAGDASGFRFIVFLGIVKYGILQGAAQIENTTKTSQGINTLSDLEKVGFSGQH